MIRIDTRIEFANACDLEVLEAGSPPEVRFTPDPHGGPEVLWFAFRILCDAPLPLLRITLKNHQNMLGGAAHPEQMRPVFRRAAAGEQESWQRLGEPEISTLPDGRRLVHWDIPQPSASLDVAWCFPYGPADVNQLVADSGGYWKADTIAVSQSSRPIVRLSNDGGAEGSTTPGLYLLARQHSGETPGSWVLDGMLRHFARMRPELLVWCVPLSNIDGVVGGDYGKDNFPYDLNRAWPANMRAMRHETHAIANDIRLWAGRCRACLGIDMHAPGACESEGIYGFIVSAEQHIVQHRQSQQIAKAIVGKLGTLGDEKSGRVPRYKSRWDTPTFTQFMAGALGLPAMSFETPYGFCNGTLMTIDDYRRAGELMAGGVIEQLTAAQPAR